MIKLYRRMSTSVYISEGCPKENKLYRKVVQRIVLECCPTVRVGGCPKNCFGELSNNSPRRIFQRICSEGCPIMKLY